MWHIRVIHATCYNKQLNPTALIQQFHFLLLVQLEVGECSVGWSWYYQAQKNWLWASPSDNVLGDVALVGQKSVIMGIFTLRKSMECLIWYFRGQAWKWYPSFPLIFHWPVLVTWAPLDAKNMKNLEVILI